MRRSSDPKVFRNHMLMQRGDDYRVIQGKIEFTVKLRKGETYTVYPYHKSLRFELYNYLGELKEEGVLEL